MCGVIGLIYERPRPDLGIITSALLKTLEYRGYDSTGAAIQNEGMSVTLRKGVGAPSVMVNHLGIVDLPGQVLCGQVRWATFGAVDEQNAQPHVVSCKVNLYGAHNGNVTNCDLLKTELTAAGHTVLSDNDGEMVVHTVEDEFAKALARLTPDARETASVRREAMRDAIAQASQRLEGSFAAVIVDPQVRTVWGIKRGSSFYFGLGEDEVGGNFGIASSDLSSVLKLTRVLVPLSEGEFVEFDGTHFEVYGLTSEARPEPRAKKPLRSRLRAKDTALVPPFQTFIDQEIHAQEAASQDVIRVFAGGSLASRAIAPLMDGLPADERTPIQLGIERLTEQYSDAALKTKFQELMSTPAFLTLLGRLPQDFRNLIVDKTHEALADDMCSADRGLFADLLTMTSSEDERLALRLLDALLEQQEVHEYAAAITTFCQRCLDTIDRGGRIFLVCCGTSYHAAKAASLFFNDLASTEVLALLPGEFRGQYADTVRDGDLFIAVSQSGETKDLIDVVNKVIRSGRDIGRIGIVNNVNSTLAQEKSDVVIPLRCGPEIAVPATKSFINQLTVFYCLAVRLAERRLTTNHIISGQAETAELSRRNLRLPELPGLIRRTLEETDAALDEAADLLYLAPSIHLLATRLLAIAKEGALKIRETVLNHTEGFEGSEFKHGPNTILGVNTVYGPKQIDALCRKLGAVLAAETQRALAEGHSSEAIAHRIQNLTAAVFPSEASTDPALGKTDRETLLDTLYADYPLVFITGPDDRDVALTVSQINTHKIRGACTVIIAEEDLRLRGAAEKAPADNPDYRHIYIPLPQTKDTLMAMFSATVALQRLALKMSLKKMHYLDALGLKGHGVHPDVPKNVSKSITVD